MNVTSHRAARSRQRLFSTVSRSRRSIQRLAFGCSSEHPSDGCDHRDDGSEEDFLERQETDPDRLEESEGVAVFT
jgi:hypothetical protein